MARVNIEDDLWTSGRLAKLARVAKLDEDRALGRLVSVYRLTQRAGIVAETKDRIVTVSVIAFDTDGDAAAFVDAMVCAQLATTLEDGQIHIRGNEKHVERLGNLKTYASKGGQISYQKKVNDSLTVSSAQAQLKLEKSELSQTLPSPFSLLPSPNSQNQEINTNTKIPEGVTKKRKRSAGAPPTAVSQVRSLWLDEYQKRYGQPGRWGAREGGQCTALLGTWTAEDLLTMVPMYFAWARPEVIRSGHPFGVGMWAFTFRIHELRADLVDPKRRAQAAVIAKHEANDNKTAQKHDQLARLVSQTQEPTGNDQQLDHNPHSHPTRNLGTRIEGPAPIRDTLQNALRRGPSALDGVTDPDLFPGDDRRP